MTNNPNDRPVEAVALLPRTYESWELKDAVREENEQARKINGVGYVDTWNMDEFFATVIANGIILLGSRASGLPSQSEWEILRRNHFYLDGETYQEGVLKVIENLHSYAQAPDTFVRERGEEAITRTLRSVFTMRGYWFHDLAPHADVKAPEIDVQNLDNSKEHQHHDQRIQYGVSIYDSIRLDLFLLKTFSKGLRQLDVSRHGYPATMEDHEWSNLLNTMAHDFEVASYNDAVLPQDETIDNFIQYFGYFWD